MGVARRGLDIAVSEQLADHRKGFAERQRAGSEAVAQVVKGELRRPQALRTTGRSG